MACEKWYVKRYEGMRHQAILFTQRVRCHLVCHHFCPINMFALIVIGNKVDTNKRSIRILKIIRLNRS